MQKYSKEISQVTMFYEHDVCIYKTINFINNLDMHILWYMSIQP
jgi:hypothetical protein